jgi:PAS domain S-box-containing protein
MERNRRRFLSVTNLDAVLATSELIRRPFREPNYRAETEALHELMEGFAQDPSKVLQRLVEVAMRCCGATSAGLSVDETDADGRRAFRWHATAGRFAPLLNTTLPYEASPCGHVVRTQTTQLMHRLELAYPIADTIDPWIREVLLAPFFTAGTPVGTLWVVDHGDSRRFDAEDRRILESLAGFAAIAWRGYCERQEVQQGHERFRAVFEQAPDDAMLMMDIDRNLTAWNPAAERITGWSAEEVLGQPADLLFTHEDRERGLPAQTIARATLDGRSESGRWYLRKDGSRFWGSGTMNALHDAAGGVAGFLKIFRDATARHEETQGLAFLSRMADAIARQRAEGDVIQTCVQMLGEFLDVSRVSFSLANEEGTHVHVREEWRRDVPSIIGTHTVADFGPEVRSDFDAGRLHISRDAEKDYAPGIGLEAVRAIKARSGISIPLLKEAKLAGLLVVHHREPRDWTEGEIALVRQAADRMLVEAERARAEADLRASEERLEAAVVERTAQLQTAVREAESFNYSIAHDLRAPLRAIISTANIVMEEAGPNLRQEHYEMLERQAFNASRLGRLIDELLRLSRLARVEVVPRPLNLTALARSLAAGFDGCKIDVEEAMHTQGDLSLVEMVLRALIENACKFSPCGGSVYVGREQDAFYVRDEGIGFDMVYAHKVFLPFERLVTEEQFPGTGIGLALVKRIVDRHGGRVWAKSEPSKGSTFYFTLMEGGFR